MPALTGRRQRVCHCLPTSGAHISAGPLWKTPVATAWHSVFSPSRSAARQFVQRPLGGEARRQNPLRRRLLLPHLQSPRAAGQVFRPASRVLLAREEQAAQAAVAALLDQRGRDSPMHRISQNDWHNQCQCGKCQAVAKAEGSQMGTGAVVVECGDSSPLFARKGALSRVELRDRLGMPQPKTGINSRTPKRIPQLAPAGYNGYQIRQRLPA